MPNIRRKTSKTKAKPVKVTINQAIEEFPNYLYREGNSDSTKTAYISDLKLFQDFLREELSGKIRYIHDITKVEIKQFKDYLLHKVQNKELTSTTIKRKFNALKTFFRFMEDEYGITNIIKADKFGNKKFGNHEDDLDNYLPNTLTPIDINHLLATIKSSKDKNMYRDFAIFQMLINFGCRRSEVLNLRWRDIDFYNNTIKITRPKPHNADILPMTESMKKALMDYKGTLQYYHEYVFVSRENNQLSPTAFTTLIQKYIRMSKLNEEKPFPITAHIFRHTFVTTCIKNNVPLRKICRFTGHRDVNTLAIYEHLVTEELKGVSTTMESLYQI